MPALNIVRRIIAVLAFLTALTICIQVIGELNRVKLLKSDLAEINNIRYGLMDSEEWLSRISEVLERRITEFEITDANRPQIRQAIEQALDQILVQLETYFRQRAQPKGDILEDFAKLFQRGVQVMVFDVDEARQMVPQFAEQILEELSRPESRRALKDQLMIFLNQATASSFSPVDRSTLNAIMHRYKCDNPQICSRYINILITQAQKPLLFKQLALYGLVLLIFGMLLFVPKQKFPSGMNNCCLDSFSLAILTCTTLLLLAGGVLTPMIEIDARISSFNMQMMGEYITFSNQVLYFQSKSVFDVVSILSSTGAADMIFVAVLLVTFSVLFPTLKVLASFFYFYNRRAAQSGLVQFFALRSSKWSMADVFVVASFMAYIGFSGLVGSQLGALSRTTRSVELLTTNGTALDGGFFLFVGFVLTSLVLSTFLEKCSSRDRTPKTEGRI